MRTHTSPSKKPSRWHLPVQWRAIYTLVPVVLGIASSINTLWNQFASDDLVQVLNNAFIKSFSNFAAAFTTSVWSFAGSDIIFTVDSYFRPIFTSLFTLNYWLFGTVPWGWHLINILIHGTVTLLVFLVSKEITSQPWVACISAALFAVHPVHAESVAWISGVTDPLMALFLLPAFYFYMRFRKKGARHSLALSVGFYFVALLSKETAIALPLVIAYCEVFYHRAQEPLMKRLNRASLMTAVFVVPTVIYFTMRYAALDHLLFGGQARNPLTAAFLTVPIAAIKYVELMSVPHNYSYQHYTDLVQSPGITSFVLPLLVLLTIASCILSLKSKPLTLAAIWFVVMLAPALAAIRQFEPAYLVQERYLYVPSMGFFLALALGAQWLVVRMQVPMNRSVAFAAITIPVLVLGVLCIRQNRVWYDSLTVFQNSVSIAPRSAIAHSYLSRTLNDAGRPREAESEARLALDLDSHCASAFLNLSYFAKTSGKLDKACEYLESGLAVVPETTMTRQDLSTIYLNLGLLYAQRKMFDRCEQNLLRSIEVSPRAVAWYYTGQFYFDQGRFEDALALYQRTLENVPHWFARIHLKLGLTYEALKDLASAENEFNQYLDLAPGARDRDEVRNHLISMKRGTPTS